MDLIAGVEGGASHSQLIVVDSKGKSLYSAIGKSSNHWILGLSQAAANLVELLRDAKIHLGMKSDEPFLCVGLALSGAETEDFNQKLRAELEKHMKENYFIASDTAGTIATGCKNGGMCLISGTGTNCFLLNPDGKGYKCGGWGHILGDEGSGYTIAITAIRTIFRVLDNFIPLGQEAPSIDLLKDELQAFFQLKHVQDDMLPIAYTNFEKSKIAAFCVKVAEAAKKGDVLSKQIFTKAGSDLGLHVRALLPKVDPVLLNQESAFRIICVGSVWKSFGLLKEGFESMLPIELFPKGYELVTVNDSCAIGAAIVAAKNNLKMDIPYNPNSHCQSIYSRKN